MKLQIKYMVSNRCKMVVEEELNKLGVKGAVIKLGEVEVPGEITRQQHDQLNENLLRLGLEIYDNKKAILTEKVKNLITELIQCPDEVLNVNFADRISKELDHDYAHLSTIFSEISGITIQQFVIQHKIEKVKELLLYDDLNLTEISYQLQYSSVAHLFTQFKKVTGISPSVYRKLKYKGQSPNTKNSQAGI